MKKTTYAPIIKHLREERNLSQAYVAGKTGMSRASFVAVEKGTKELTLREAVALTHLFNITLDALITCEAPDTKKYQQMMLAFIRLATASKHFIKKTKLAKLLYVTDFSWYYLHRKSMSGVSYKRFAFGPVAEDYLRLLEEMEQAGIITIKQIYRDDYHMYEIEETRGSRKKKLTALTTIEMSHIEKMWTAWAGASTAEIVQFTEAQRPYQNALEGGTIAYEDILEEASHMIF
jgi:transcriptional regulator with XRE-family HTH domain